MISWPYFIIINKTLNNKDSLKAEIIGLIILIIIAQRVLFVALFFKITNFIMLHNISLNKHFSVLLFLSNSLIPKL